MPGTTSDVIEHPGLEVMEDNNAEIHFPLMQVMQTVAKTTIPVNTDASMEV